VACAALVVMGWSLSNAYQRVLEARPGSAPTDGQLETLRRLAEDLRKSQNAPCPADSQ
jgi:hypothetical protein